MEEKLIPAPIDNKNLLEDSFEDDVFKDFYAAYDHRDGSRSRHLIGTLCVREKDLFIDAIVGVSWNFGDNTLSIKLLACPPTEDFLEVMQDVITYYKGIFSKWENPDNENLRVKFEEKWKNMLDVAFFFEVEE